jgi:flagellar basal body-associated protein FliL
MNKTWHCTKSRSLRYAKEPGRNWQLLVVILIVVVVISVVYVVGVTFVAVIAFSIQSIKTILL